MVSNLDCEVSKTGTILSVKVTSKALKHVEKQAEILEAAAAYLKAYPLNQIYGIQSVRVCFSFDFKHLFYQIEHK